MFPYLKSLVIIVILILIVAQVIQTKLWRMIDHSAVKVTILMVQMKDYLPTVQALVPLQEFAPISINIKLIG